MSERFEPRIVAFLCNWCSYAGADNAGIARMESPANVLPIRVMCSGRVSPEMILRSFRSGADGVLVLGCHIGDCHYVSGNHRTAKRLPLLRNLLSYVGVNPDRLRLDWVSSAEAPKFARVTAEFVETVRELGPAAGELGELAERVPAEAGQGGVGE
jgi:F420-non-reducing hydrogenase iron-sulfur subunit